MPEIKLFTIPGDTCGQWTYLEKLTHSQKLAYLSRDPDRTDKEVIKLARREWIRVKCLGCQTEHVKRADGIRSKRSTRCGTCRWAAKANPYATEAHALYPIYVRCMNIDQRCNNERNPNFPSYGGRGITVSPEYSMSYQYEKHGNARLAIENLVAEIGLPPGNDFVSHSIDRIDNEGNYEEGNLRWATRKQQGENTRQTKLIHMPDGTKISAAEFARQHNLKAQTVNNRLKKGYSTDDAALPVGGRMRVRTLEHFECVKQQIKAGDLFVSEQGTHVFKLSSRGVTQVYPHKMNSGYMGVSIALGNDGTKRPYQMHRLVAIQYLTNPDPSNYTIVAHKNDRKVDNDVRNLIWCTHEINSQARFGDVRYLDPEYVNLSPFTESEVLAKVDDLLPDRAEYVTAAEVHLRWGRVLQSILGSLENDKRFRGSIFAPDHPDARKAWRLLLAPSNKFMDNSIEVQIGTDKLRKSVFDLSFARDWLAYFVWYPDELESFGLDFDAWGWSRRPLEEPVPGNIRDAIGERRLPLLKQKRVVSHSLFLKYPEIAMRLYPGPGKDELPTHPLYIMFGSKSIEYYLLCAECKARVPDAYTPKEMSRNPETGHRRMLCASCRQKQAVSNLLVGENRRRQDQDQDQDQDNDDGKS